MNMQHSYKEYEFEFEFESVKSKVDISFIIIFWATSRLFLIRGFLYLGFIAHVFFMLNNIFPPYKVAVLACNYMCFSSSSSHLLTAFPWALSLGHGSDLHGIVHPHVLFSEWAVLMHSHFCNTFRYMWGYLMQGVNTKKLNSKREIQRLRWDSWRKRGTGTKCV